MAAIEADRNQVVHLFRADFSSGTTYATDAYRPVVWGGNTYLANGHLLSYTGIEESAELQVTQARFALSGVDQSLISTVLLENVLDRRIRVWTAFLDADDAIIGDPILIFDGRMDAPSIDEDPAGGSCTVAISASNQFADFNRRAGRRTNDAEQQVLFPGDRGFEYVSALTRSITWGR
ncbi:MAG: hypothetical protein WCS09_02775 [Pseudomonadota bacterium]